MIVARWVAGGAFRGGFPVDDAWIHMVYGLALRTEGSLAYNTGTPATGCTSPLWAMVVGVAHLGSREPSMGAALAVKVIGIALQGGCAFLAAHLAATLAPTRTKRLAAWSAGLLVAFAPIGAYAAVSGMEVALTTALLLGTFAALASRRVYLASFLAGLCVVARPEAIVVLPVVFAFAVRPGPALLSLAPPAALLARTYLVSGRLLPATFYIKARAPSLDRIDVRLRFVFEDMFALLEPYGRWVVLAMILGAGLGLVRRRRFETALALAMVVTAIAWVLGLVLTISAPDPEAFYWQRYYAPALPLLLVGGVIGTTWLGQSLRVRIWLENGVSILMALLAFVPEVLDLPRMRERYGAAVEAIDQVQVKLGLDLAQRAGVVVWSQDAGAPRYFGRKRIVDLNRLNTPELLVTPEAAPSPSLVLLPSAMYALEGGLTEIVSAQPAVFRERVSRQTLFACPPGGHVTVTFRSTKLASASCAP